MATTEAGRFELLGKRLSSEMEMSIGSTIGGLGLVVLGILALDEIDGGLLNSIGVVVAGVVFLIESASLSSSFMRALQRSQTGALDVSQLAAGMNASMLAGISGLVLGILGILGLAAGALAAVAVIVFGAAVLFDFVARAQMRALQMTANQGSEEAARLALAVASSTNMAALLVGAALITLGILALAGTVTEVLVAVALLGLGAYLFLEGSAVVGYVLSMVS